MNQIQAVPNIVNVVLSTDTPIVHETEDLSLEL